MRNTKLITVPKLRTKGVMGTEPVREGSAPVSGGIGRNIYARFRARLKANHNLKGLSGVNYASYNPGDKCSTAQDNFTLTSHVFLSDERDDEGPCNK